MSGARGSSSSVVFLADRAQPVPVPVIASEAKQSPAHGGALRAGDCCASLAMTAIRSRWQRGSEHQHLEPPAPGEDYGSVSTRSSRWMISSRPRQPRIASISSRPVADDPLARRRWHRRTARAPAAAPSGPATTTGSPRWKLPSTPRTPAGSSERPRLQRPRRAGIHGQRAQRRQRPGDPALARRAALRRGQEPGAARALRQRGQRTRPCGRGRSPWRSRPGWRSAPPPAWCACRPRNSRAAARRPSPRSPASAPPPPGCARRGRVAARVGGVEAVDVGQQHKLVGLHHLGDARGQAVVVAEADFGGRDGVVLVDHRDAAERQQRVQRGAGVEVAAAVLGVVQRQQQLRGGQAGGRQRLAPGLGQADLADRGGGLLLLQPQALAGQAAACGGPARWRRRRPRSPRRRARAGRRCRRRCRPARRCAARASSGVHHQGAADLHHQALRGGERGDHAGSVARRSG